MVYRNDIRIPNRLKLFDPGQCCPYMMSSVTNGGSHPAIWQSSRLIHTASVVAEVFQKLLVYAVYLRA